MDWSLEEFLANEIGIIPPKDEARFPSREQAHSKNFYNAMNLTQEGDGSWTPNF